MPSSPSRDTAGNNGSPVSAPSREDILILRGSLIGLDNLIDSCVKGGRLYRRNFRSTADVTRGAKRLRTCVQKLLLSITGKMR